jgi:tRNA threonylcarbamoyladenosine biosynthesis protein TsaE
LVEWPEKGYGMLPEADLDIDIRYQDDHRIVSLTANSEYGQRLLSQLELC